MFPRRILPDRPTCSTTAAYTTRRVFCCSRTQASPCRSLLGWPADICTCSRHATTSCRRTASTLWADATVGGRQVRLDVERLVYVNTVLPPCVDMQPSIARRTTHGARIQPLAILHRSYFLRCVLTISHFASRGSPLSIFLYLWQRHCFTFGMTR